MIGMITILIVIVILFIGYMTTSKNNLNTVIVILLIIFNYILGILICKYSVIPPIEVYRGNTTLQITYEGNTPIDSTVVWKVNN
jgi:hypothetical protein